MSLARHLKPLRAVYAVAAAGSAARAAQAMHVSQPSVTRAVQSLEAALGTALFERSSRGMLPTPAGQAVVRRAGRALQHLASAGPGPARAGAAAADWRASRLAASVGHRHLVAMLSLSQTLSETASARALAISQPAVQQTLAQLEHLAGAALFQRARRGLRLTEAGEALLRAAKLALSELAQADDELAAQHGLVQGRIVVGTLPFSTARLLPQAVDRVLREHPDVSVTIVDGTWDALVHRLRQAELDLIVGALRPSGPGADLQQQPLFVDSLAVVARAGHPLARRARLRWADLKGAAWVMPMPNTPAQAAFEQALAAAGLPLPPSPLRVNSALMMQALVAQGDRLAMMAPSQLRAEIGAGLLVALPLPVRHAPRHIGLVRRAGDLPTPAVQALLDALAEVAATIVAEAGRRGIA